MMQNRKPASSGGIIILGLVLLNAIALRDGYTGERAWYLALIVTLPLLFIAIINNRKTGKQHLRINRSDASGVSTPLYN